MYIALPCVLCRNI